MGPEAMTYSDVMVLLLRVIWKIAVLWYPAVLLFVGYLVWEAVSPHVRVRELALIKRRTGEIRNFRWQKDA